jgi:hypothetical protein
MSKEDLYELRRQYRERTRQTEREYSKKATEAAVDSLSLPQRKLKKAISGDESSWGLPDFEFNMNVGNRAGYRGTATLTDEGLEPVLDVVADPLNAVGAGLFTSGVRGARKIAGASSLAGNTFSAARNFIPNFYGPSKTAQPTLVDELIMQNQNTLGHLPKIGPKIRNLETAQDSANMREKAGSFINWAVDSAGRALSQTVSPTARANYRQNQVTQTMQDTAREALQSGGSRDTAKAVAQSQATENIANQAGRTGAKSEAVEDLNRRSFLTEPVKATEGSYVKLIRDNKITGTYAKSGQPVGVSNKDLQIVEDHVMRVWKDRQGRSVSETPTADIRIKNPGSGDQVTGSHVLDFRQKSGVHRAMNALYKDNPNPTLEETWKHLKDSGIKLHPQSKTLEDARENGIWVTGSFSGNAITEGGVNYIAKVNPNGRVMAVISDEHNFLEKTPVLGPVVDAALPNRSISVTPPIFFDIKKNKGKIDAPQPQDKKNVKDSLFDIATARPSAELLREELKVNAGAATTGTGLFTGGQDDER